MERHDHRPAPTLPRELPPLFFSHCVGHHPTYYRHHPRLTDCLLLPSSLSQAPRLSAHLQLNSHPRRIPQSRPVQSSPALLALLALPCPAPALPSSLPSPIDRPPRKKPPSCLAVPCEQKSCPLSSIHPLRLPSLLPLLFSSGLLCSRLLLSPFSSVCFWSAHSSICGRQKPPVASHPVGLKHPDSGASCSPDLRTNLCRQRHIHTTTTTTIPQQHLTSSWLLSPT